MFMGLTFSGTALGQGPATGVSYLDSPGAGWRCTIPRMADDDFGEIGGELDMDAIERQATQVQRKALDLDFGEVVPRKAKGAGRQSGGGSLDAGAFLTQKEREAMARAQGATPTLDRLGKKKARRSVAPVAQFDAELSLRHQGIPTWVWVAAVLLTFAGGFGAAMWIVWNEQQTSLEAEARSIYEAQQRIEDTEAERQRRMK